MKITPNTYIISDLHFGHNMQKFGVRPDGFDALILKRWNETVTKNDKILCLGDLTMTEKTKSIEYFSKFKGTKYLILGNHDNHSETWYKDCGFEVVEPIYKQFKDKYENQLRIFFTHEPVLPLPQDSKAWKDEKTGMSMTGIYYFNIHGHLHGSDHHEVPRDTDRYLDMSAEVISYTPQPLYTLLDKFKRKIKGGEK